MRGGKRLQELLAASLQMTNTRSLIHAPTDTILHFSCLQRQAPGSLFSHVLRTFLSQVQQLPNPCQYLHSVCPHSWSCVSDGPPTRRTWVHADGTAAPTHSCPVFIHTHAHPACRSFGSFSAGSWPDSTAAPRPNSQSPTPLKKQGETWKHSMSHCQLKHLCLRQRSGCVKINQQKRLHRQETVFTLPGYFQFRFVGAISHCLLPSVRILDLYARPCSFTRHCC